MDAAVSRPTILRKSSTEQLKSQPLTSAVLRKAVTLPGSVMLKHAPAAAKKDCEDARRPSEVTLDMAAVARMLLGEMANLEASSTPSSPKVRSAGLQTRELDTIGLGRETAILSKALEKAHAANRKMRKALLAAQEGEALARENELAAAMSAAALRVRNDELISQLTGMRRDLLERSLLLARAAAAVELPESNDRRRRRGIPPQEGCLR